MKKLWIPALLLLLAAAAYLLFQREQATPSHPERRLAQVYVAAEGRVETMPGFDIDVGTGELNGKVARILVQEGQRVEQGQLVALLENQDLAAEVVSAERNLSFAERRLAEIRSGSRPEEILQAAAALEGATAATEEAQKLWARFRELHGRGMVSDAALDDKERAYRVAEARAKEAQQQKKLLEEGPKTETVAVYREQVALARANLDHSRKRLEKTQIRAPISGTVIKRYLDEGEGITPEIPILAIADLEKIWINAEVDETDIGRIQVGDPVGVTSDAYRDSIFKGRIRQVSNYAGSRKVKPNDPAVNLGLKVVEVKIELQDQTPLRLGMTVNVRVTPQAKGQ